MMNKMSRQDAANLLDNLVGMVDDNQGNDYDTALKMGIKALSDVTDTNVGDMICRQAALNALSAHKKVLQYIMDKCGVTEEVNKTIEIIYNLPAADAIEVVRCKDCKHLFEDNKCPLRTWWTHTEDDFCSHGERKDA